MNVSISFRESIYAKYLFKTYTNFDVQKTFHKENCGELKDCANDLFCSYIFIDGNVLVVS
jgi:hypothetical protein